ncbi:alanyl-tRNA editing protein [Pseudomonas cannabina]|uniref:Alanyl tRNA synthetase-related protein n=5 Tax=Pseudomonas syringae group TaxID=136849 RepID=Q87W52_PSESM|nr:MULTISPECIES: alanyl-tRNA editing protein [Pseudomonas syringae group]AUW27307.1 PSPTO_4713 [synthetic construct]KGS16011.1 alanyl-tRNA synthetase [Pseudomonas coronafaciens]AAO58152.1 alanyl tRNA synthetase-related protein [Pseudomonas syringae pv. tomato str. DC3000]KKI27531.1 alanyl-tRNA synthetase [Pseudomonas syringae pv. persicae]KOP56749.1 alanyl-tRNA synthetase [Pseudomonas coronafaciens pv. porri]
MERAFWNTPYLSSLDARVLSIDGRDVVISPTIFFAESGGQESDKGCINRIEVTQATVVDERIIYRLAEDPDFAVSDLVSVEIDWPRRYALMRLHFAAEIVLEFFYKKFPDLEKIGAHIGQHKARIDFSLEGNVSQYFPEILQGVEHLVAAGLPIESRFTDTKCLRRCWYIKGFSEVPCGGTHLRTTGEVGRIRLKRNNIGAHKERVEIYLVD